MCLQVMIWLNFGIQGNFYDLLIIQSMNPFKKNTNKLTCKTKFECIHQKSLKSQYSFITNFNKSKPIVYQSSV